MISVDGSLFIQIVNFLFLIWILNVILYKPIRNVLIQRKEKIGGMEQKIEKAAKDAEDKEGAFASGIREARAEGIKERDALIQEANQEEKRIVEEINKKAQANLAQVREKIAKEADGVRGSLQSEIEAFAQAIGEKILGRAI